MLGGAVAILAVSSLLRRRMDATVATAMAVMTALAALSLSLVQWFHVRQPRRPRGSIDSAVVEDGFSALRRRAGVVRGVARPPWSADGWMRREKATGPEFHVLMLLSSARGR